MPISLNLTQAINQAQAAQPPRVINRIEAVEKKAQYQAAAYCRVSTDHEDQEGSIEVQRDHFLSIITLSPDMSFVDIYFEQGVSGTKKETRPELQRLLSDCKRGRVNLVLTKSISRFARNTSDCLEMVRSLTALGVALIFEKENIDTRYMDSEFLLTILASLAENESRSFSENNRWAIQKRFRDGTYRPAKAPFGYDLADGKYVVNPYEADKVRYIFSQYISGAGPAEIARIFNQDKVLMKRDGEKWKEPKKRVWSNESILSILKNVNYVGDALCQQSYHDHDFKVKTNRGQYPQYLIENRHEPIISRDDFLCAQKLIEQHRKERSYHRNVVHHLLTGKLFCGCCGSPMKRLSRRKGATNCYSWGCKEHEERKSCEALPVLEEGVINATKTLINKLRFLAPILPDYAEALDREWREAHREEIGPLEEQLSTIKWEKTQLSLLWAHNSMEAAAYYLRKNELETDERLAQAALGRLFCPQAEEIRRLQKAQAAISESLETFLDEFVDCITVPDRFHCVFHLRCGLCLRERVMSDIL